MKTLLTLASVALATTTFAAGPNGGPGNPGGPGMRGPHGAFEGPRDPIVQMVTRPEFAEKIGLTDEQKAKIKEVAAGSRESQKELRKQLRDAMEKQTDLLEAEKVDEAAVMAEIDKAFEVRKQMAKAQTKRIIAIKSILTPEQIAKALELSKAPPKGEGPKCEGPKCEGPKCEGPQCEGPQCGERPPCPPPEA